MTNDATLNIYLSELQSIIEEINSIKEGIRADIVGLGEEKSIASLEFISTCYSNIKNNIITNYYFDEKNYS